MFFCLLDTSVRPAAKLPPKERQKNFRIPQGNNKINKLILRLPESQDSLSVAYPKTQNTLHVYIFSTFGNVR